MRRSSTGTKTGILNREKEENYKGEKERNLGVEETQEWVNLRFKKLQKGSKNEWENTAKGCEK